MSLKIRLSRHGTKKRPFYHIVIADSRAARDGKYLEKIGTYNPMLPGDAANRVTLDQERAKHWLSVGATPSERVQIFLAKQGLASMPERRESPKKSAPRAKTQERMKAAAGAEAKPAEAAAPATEAPAAEAAK